ncbi:fimbrillin family protein [Bacteroides pyogenes]|uniref:fimbrillin family protein n=1 Tax=Bacteroides pyogenes TaxID=310300 RepID=UPI0003DD0CC4|nr:fimbrillin family protein [Bacteroides pyogenes]GAE23661.1 hypothetical protein JCM10003_3469 [Bacteroides pyogenes JCM 10003]SUV34168.1 putative lipoprotein [Bacteroides pyogenes]
MKYQLNLKRRIFLPVILLLASACVNHISEENEITDNAHIPLRIAGDIKTRVAGNEFQSADEVGLFALVESTTLKEERYADNIKFIYSSDGEFIAEEMVCYPDDDVKLDLISYYPYRTEGVKIGESVMPVETEADQSIPANLSKSDFLLAVRKTVSPSKNPVSLTYTHKLFRLKVSIKPEEGENIADLLQSDPKLSVSGFYRKAAYDLQQDDYSSYSAEEEITAAGKWEIQDGRLVGKEFILIPQKIQKNHQYLTLNIKGKDYISRLNSSLAIGSGKQREVQISFASAEDVLLNHLNGEIHDWEDGGKESISSKLIHNYIDISNLTFQESDVYKVLSEGKQVAEICKEYLVAQDGFTSQAIVAYPMKEGKTDLSGGKVLRCLGNKENIHGGSVSWDIDNNSLMYLPGTLAARNYLFVSSGGRVVLSLSEADKPLPVMVVSDVIRDARGDVIHNYPIVKIGTQYWMRDNLEASLYSDGTEIKKLDTIAEGNAGCLFSSEKAYFYTMGAVNSHKLLPSGWQIPGWKDWELLQTYLKNDASALKSGSWSPIKEGETVFQANNLSGFNASPSGMAWGKFQKEYDGKYAAYWTMDEKGTAVDAQILLLQTNKNEMDRGRAAADKACSVRCIRK